MKVTALKIGSASFGLALLFIMSWPLAAQSQAEETSTAPTTGTISGRVISDAGQPVPGAAVSLRGSSPFFQPRMAATDSEGNFQVTGLGAELYGISAFAPGYISPPRDPDKPPNYYRIGDSVDVSLVKGGVITGAVMSAVGEPVVQITVRAMMIRDANGQPPRFPVSHSPRSTDDRGVYRIYGLLPGTYLVAAGGRNNFGVTSGAYDTDASTFSPSSTRDTAAEIVVKAGEETAGVDIRYRAEPGRVISGVVVGPIDPTGPSQPSVNLTHVSNGISLGTAFSFQPLGGKGFSFYGVSDGDYDLVAQVSQAPGQLLISDPRRVTVKGADVTGVELAVKPLGSIEGRLTLESSAAAECKNKRRPLFPETLISARRTLKSTEKEQSVLQAFSGAQGSPNQSGDFVLRNLVSGDYSLSARFFARYWFLRSIGRDAPGVRPTAKAGTANRTLDIARNGLSLKSGERASGITITLAEGAGSLRGTIKLAPSESLPPKNYVHLVASEKENAEDVLRMFATPVNSDGTFALNNLPPGNYWVIARTAGENVLTSEANVRTPETELRTRIRRAAEAANTRVELKPCQNITDYLLPITSPVR